MGKLKSRVRSSGRLLFWSALALSWASPLSAAPPPVAAAAEPLPAEAIRADFSQLYARLKEAHFDLYARVSKAAYDRFHRDMLAEMDGPLPPLEVARRFQRFTAFGRIAHARIDAAYGLFEKYLTDGGKAFPLTLRLSGGRAFVARNRSGVEAIRPGDRILALDGRPIAWWLARCARNLSADNRYMARSLLELDLPMLLWLEMGPVESYDVTLRQADGRETRLQVPSRTRADMRGAFAAQAPRLDLARSDRSWKMLEGGVGYLRPGAFYNTEPDAVDMYDNAGFRRFIDTAFEGIVAGGAEALLIDLRDNPGGDSSFSDLMVSWFADRPYKFNSAFLIKVSPEATESNAPRLALSPPGSIAHRFAALYAAARPGDIVRFEIPAALPRPGRRYRGRVFLLINRNSFSNAVTVAATVQDYRFGTIIGEETSDLATTYGAMESFVLPRTGLKVGFPKARIVRPSGDSAARGVRPDIRIATPVLEGPDDPVLQRAVAIVRARTPRR